MIIAKRDRRYKILIKCDNTMELFRKLEETAYEFILSLEVQPERYFKKSKSGYYKTHKFGYFMVSSWDKITIFRKYISTGVFYNSTVVDKIVTYFLIRPKPEPQPRVSDENVNENMLMKVEYFEDIHREILERVDNKKKNDSQVLINL